MFLYIRKIQTNFNVSRQFKLSKTSEQKLKSWLSKLKIEDTEFSEQFYKIVYNDCKMIKDCSEKSIIDFYIDTAKELMKEMTEFDEEFYANLKSKTRIKLANKYANGSNFDNNIDIYFNDVKREYILHPQNESEDLVFIPENKDIFIKNNLKLVIECAKRYQNLGIPFEDLIQIGNIGLLTAFEKFDAERSNLRISILNDIKEQDQESFNFNEASNIIKRNFQYCKLLDATLKKIPESGFANKEDFNEWVNKNIKKASFSSIAFFWIRAIIIGELNNFSKLIRVPKSAQNDESTSISILRLDSINPHTDDNYHDNQIAEIANEEFAIEDESIENLERQNLFKDLISKLLCKLSAVDRRIIQKKFGINLPFPMSIGEIAESEGLSSNKVKYSISNSIKIIAANIPAEDKKTIMELLG